MIAKLRKLLAECHIQKKEAVLLAVMKADMNYCVQRALEELELFKADGRDDRLKLATQLLTIARYKKCFPGTSNTPAVTGQKQPFKKPSSRSYSHRANGTAR